MLRERLLHGASAAAASVSSLGCSIVQVASRLESAQGISRAHSDFEPEPAAAAIHMVVEHLTPVFLHAGLVPQRPSRPVLRHMIWPVSGVVNLTCADPQIRSSDSAGLELIVTLEPVL